MNLGSNPWLAIPDSSPYVLSEDATAIDRFNQRATDRTRIETSLLPEPFVGRLDAPILLLALNPGVSDGDFGLHQDPRFSQKVRGCWKQEPVEWPYYYLDPDVSGPGARWTAKVLKPLIQEFGAVRVANAVVLFEFFPYHSRGFAHERLRLGSQEYTFDLLRGALQRAAAVFVTRGLRIWHTAVPELVDHPRLFRTRSVQNIVISPRNCPEGWQAAVAGIKESPHG